jgi:hypothetical protein
MFTLAQWGCIVGFLALCAIFPMLGAALFLFALVVRD